MPIDLLLALLTLTLTAAFTPGPNNALLASSGANFGLRRTLPHVMGVGFGFSLMIFLVGLFLGEIFQASPLLRNGLQWFGAAVLVWMAWKIANAGGPSGGKTRPRPFTFVEAAAFQWINPKGWAMAIAITAQFILPAAPLKSALVVAAVCIFAGLTSATSWAVAGQALTRWINTPARLRWFNQIMALMILGCVAMIVLG